MKLITSWLKINRSLGAVIGLTVLFCALLALGKVPPGAGNAGPGKSSAAKSETAVARKLSSGGSLVPPFVGDHTETWEEFTPYCEGGSFPGSQFSILEGFATISNPNMIIYRPGTCGFGLGCFAAEVSDGAQGMGINSGNQTTTIVFSTPVIAFGAYWGANCESTISFVFKDAGGSTVDTDSFSYVSPDGNGALEWRGYHFNTPVKTITYQGDFVVTDGMQTITGLGCSEAGSIFTGSFAQNQEATEQVKQQWVDFRESLVPADYDNVTISGTFDTTGLTIHDSVIVPQIAATLKNGGSQTWTVGGVTFNVGHCGSNSVESPGTEINASTVGYSGTCQCTDATVYTVRPNLGNQNWGGVNTNTCNAPSQTLAVTFSGPSAPSCAPAPGGMVSWWRAEDNANDRQDDNNGTLKGGATFGTGEVGQGFSLNGDGQYVEVPSSANLNITGAISVDVWINPTDFSQRGIVSKYNNNDVSGRSWALQLNPNGTIEWDVQDGTPGNFRSVTTTNSIPQGVFTHIAGTFDPVTQEIKVFINGLDTNAPLDPGSATVSSIASNSTPVEIGWFFNFPGDYFSGVIDEVEIFDRALTGADVLSIYNSACTGKCPCTPPPANMIAWWPGDDNARDIQGHHNATLNDATFAPGEVSDAFNFDGQDDSVSIPPSNDWNFGTGEFTFDFWARANPAPIGDKPNSAGRRQGNANPNTNRMHALSFEPDPTFATSNLDFNFNDAGIGLFLFWNGGGGNSIQVGTTGQYTDGQWHHFALTRVAEEQLKVRNSQGGNWTLYIDGAVAGTASYSGALDLSGGSNNYIGASTGQVTESRFFWNGQIDEVEIFTRALRADEVAAIYNAGGAGKCKPQATPAPDLTATKTNNVGGNTTAGSPWTWKISVANGGASAANFASGQTILNDNLPNNFIIYGSPSISNVVNVTNSGSINCSITSSNLTCTAAGSTVSIAAGGSFDVSFTTVAGQGGAYVNPRAGGDCSVDPNNVVAESNETNNTCTDTVTVTGRPSPTPSPTPTPTPTSTPAVTPGTTGTDVDGNGTIAGPHGGQATFSMSVKLQNTGKRTAVTGNFSYNDPASHVSINQSTVSSLTINGNHAHFTGPQRTGRRGSTVSFTVDVTDNGYPGNNDVFSIQLSNGYSASGTLSTGDIQIH